MPLATLESKLRIGNLYVVSTAKLALSAFAYADLRLNATSGLPTTTYTPINQALNGNTSVAVIKADTNLITPISGGTFLYTVPVPGNSRTVYSQELIQLVPGNTLSLNSAYVGLANVVFKAYYWEE